MVTEPDWAALEAAWLPARRAGVLGSATLEELRAHAVGYLPAACGVLSPWRGVDLGTGAGIPGLLLALARPQSTWLLVDASERRCAFAESAVRSMDVGDRVTVRHARAEDVAHDPQWRGEVDLVVARSFAAPPEVAECGLPLLGSGGQLVVSVTAVTDAAWRAARRSADVSFEVNDAWTTAHGRYLSVVTPEGVPDRFPRRAAARRRAPLF